MPKNLDMPDRFLKDGLAAESARGSVFAALMSKYRSYRVIEGQYGFRTKCRVTLMHLL